ncbi:MAG: class E sortase [Sciscionella sp.]
MDNETTVGIPRVQMPPDRGRGRAGGVLHALGEVFVTLGLIVLLFVFYEVYVTDWFSAAKQSNATQALDSAWSNQRGEHFSLADGKGMAKMYIPALGADYHFTIIEGTNADDLAIGPGHYKGTALPGAPGNFAVAGHRVGKGAPFNDIDLIRPCDAIVVETESDWFVYRMLPPLGRQPDAANPKCAGVHSLGGPYADTPGQEIVLPAEGDVVAAVPHHPESTLSKGQQVALMTLTTCNPKFSDRQRLIVHAVLTKQYPKNPSEPNLTPPELKESS